jgi:hypothetical protein
VRVRRPTRPTSHELGRAARVSCPLSSHGDLVVSSLRPDPLALLDRQNADRLTELVPLRYERMAESPFTFFQGAAAVMADDLAGTPTTGIMVQLCGDAHIGNFGLYQTPAGRLVFDVRDFDETHPGPWEWDVKRLLASLAVAGRQNGYTTSQRRTVLLRAGHEYRAAVRRFAAMSNLEMWFSQADVDRLRRHHRFGRALDLRAGSARRGPTELVDGTRRLVADPPSLVPVADLVAEPALADLEDRIGGLLEDYRATLSGDSQFLLDHFRVVEVARSAGRAGATGTRTWIVLLAGRDTDEPLLLQVREAHPSVVYPLSSVETSSDHGRRVVTGQRLVQAAGDIFLGWQRVTEASGRRRDYYVRELREWLPSPALDRMSPFTMGVYGELCGWTLARAHARSGDRIALAAYLGDDDEFEATTAEFAEAYADQNLQDFRRFQGVAKVA